MTDLTKKLITALVALVVHVLEQLPQEQVTEAIGAFKAGLDTYDPADKATVTQIINDVAEVAEDIADETGNVRVENAVEKIAVFIQSISNGGTLFGALIKTLFKKKTVEPVTG